jgi:hypothetical protein
LINNFQCPNNICVSAWLLSIVKIGCPYAATTDYVI